LSLHDALPISVERRDARHALHQIEERGRLADQRRQFGRVYRHPPWQVSPTIGSEHQEDQAMEIDARCKCEAIQWLSWDPTSWHGSCEMGCGIRSRPRDGDMRMDERTDPYGRYDHRNGFDRLAGSALDYLRSRTSEHWLMFVVGLMIGLFLG